MKCIAYVPGSIKSIQTIAIPNEKAALHRLSYLRNPAQHDPPKKKKKQIDPLELALLFELLISVVCGFAGAGPLPPIYKNQSLFKSRAIYRRG